MVARDRTDAQSCVGHPCDACKTCRSGRCCRRDQPGYRLPGLGEWDGPIHGRLGVLADDGENAQCHCCGEYFALLSLHVVRSHDLTPAEYKAIFGLEAGKGLVGPSLRARKVELGKERVVNGMIERLIEAGRTAITPEQRRANSLRFRRRLETRLRPIDPEPHRRGAETRKRLYAEGALKPRGWPAPPAELAAKANARLRELRAAGLQPPPRHSVEPRLLLAKAQARLRGLESDPAWCEARRVRRLERERARREEREKAREQRACERCGQLFKLREKRTQRFCSQPCYKAARKAGLVDDPLAPERRLAGLRAKLEDPEWRAARRAQIAELNRARAQERVETSCLVCGQVFLVKPREKGKRRACGIDCGRRAKSVTREQITCAACGKGFTAPPSTKRKVCSTTCAGVMKRKDRRSLFCAVCNRSFAVEPWRKRSVCSKACALARARSGGIPSSHSPFPGMDSSPVDTNPAREEGE